MTQNAVSSGRKKIWTMERIIDAFQAFHKRRGAWPTTPDFDRHDTMLPNQSTVYRVFGTLAAARRAAGANDGGHEGNGGAYRGGGWPKGRKRRPRYQETV